MAKRPRPAASIERIRNSGTAPAGVVGALCLDDGALAEWLASLGANDAADAKVAAEGSETSKDLPDQAGPPLRFGGLIQHSLYGDPVLRLEWGDTVNATDAPAAGVLDIMGVDRQAAAHPAELVRADPAMSTDALASARVGMASAAEITIETVVRLADPIQAAATVFIDARSLIAALGGVRSESATPAGVLPALFANLRAPVDIALTLAGDSETVARFLETVRNDVFALARILGSAYADARAPIEFLSSLPIRRVAVFMRWRRRN